MEKGYMISDASKILEVENHVLRYWEEELDLPIPRNELGHRYYREEEIRLLQSVKDLKGQGFQLKAIKKLLPDLDRIKNMDPKMIYELREELNSQVMRENLEMGTSLVTPIDQARGRYERRPKTWQERSTQLEQMKWQESEISEERSRTSSAQKLHQFEMMMKNMVKESIQECLRSDIPDIMEDMQGVIRQGVQQVVEDAGKVSEERISEEISVRLTKELNYLMMQKEELQEKQVKLLQEILEHVGSEKNPPAVQAQPRESSGQVQQKTGQDMDGTGAEAAASREEIPEEDAEAEKGSRWGKRRGKKKKKKIFAKSGM